MIETCASARASTRSSTTTSTRGRASTARRARATSRSASREALAFAALITRRAHALGLAVAQKNTAELTRRQARRRVGFDFAIAEECGRYRECNAYRRVYGNHVIAIEYRRRDFRYTCRTVGDRISVVLRDVNVTAPGSRTYRYDAC